jgi:hypothetical protein
MEVGREQMKKTYEALRMQNEGGHGAKRTNEAEK